MLLFDQRPLFYIFFRGLLFHLWCDVKLSCSRKNCTSTYLYIQLHLFITLNNNIWNIFGNPRNTESISRISSGNQNMTVLQRQMLNIYAHLIIWDLILARLTIKREWIFDFYTANLFLILLWLKRFYVGLKNNVTICPKKV